MTETKCDCIATVDAKLAEYNGRVVTNMFGPKRAFVDVMRADEKRRGKPPMLQAAHCPFCGVRYEEADRARDDT